MFLSLLFILVWFYKVMGMGFSEANRNLTDIAHLVPDRLKELGHNGWTAMPAANSPQWYTLVTSLIMGVGIGCLAQPQLVVRFMMVENSRQLNRGILIDPILMILGPLPLLAMCSGAISFLSGSISLMFSWMGAFSSMVSNTGNKLLSSKSSSISSDINSSKSFCSGSWFSEKRTSREISILCSLGIQIR